MSLYGGIDLHANNSVVVLLNNQDQVIYQKRLPNHLPAILEPFHLYHGEIEGVVVESTYNWYWLVDGLMEAGYRVHLANPAAIQQYNGLKYTDDHLDARWLAHLLRLGVLLEGYIYPPSTLPPDLGRGCSDQRHGKERPLWLETPAIWGTLGIRETWASRGTAEARALMANSEAVGLSKTEWICPSYGSGIRQIHRSGPCA
jgi:hypothetical protein